MTRGTKAQLLDMLQPIFNQFGIAGFAGMVIYQDTNIEDTGEVLGYYSPTLRHDNITFIKHYQELLEADFRDCSIDMAAMVGDKKEGYLVTVNLTEQEMLELYIIASVGYTSPDEQHSKALQNALDEIRKCLQKQLNIGQVDQLNEAVTHLKRVFFNKSVDWFIAGGGYNEVRLVLSEIIREPTR